MDGFPSATTGVAYLVVHQTGGRSLTIDHPVETQDGVLFISWQAGDSSAFDALVRRHQPALNRLCGRLLGHPQAAEVDDAVQDVLLLLTRLAPEIQDPQAVGAWMRRAAFGVCANRRRAETSRRVRERISAETQNAVRSVAPANAEAADLAIRALTSLPDEQRHVVELHYLEGLKLQTIARRLQITPAAARKRLQRGVGTLRQRFQNKRNAIALLAMLSWCEAAESGDSITSSLTVKVACVPLVLAATGILVWQRPWQSPVPVVAQVSTTATQPTPKGRGNEANPGPAPPGEDPMFAKTALTLAIAATAAAAEGKPTPSPDYCAQFADICPVAAVFKKTGKAEMKITDVIKDIKTSQKKEEDSDAAVKDYLDWMVNEVDADKNGRITKIE